VQRRRYALRLAYDGAAFRGFQKQPGLPSVQGALESALEALEPTLQRRGTIATAGRTDAGVHAQEQVVSFAAGGQIPPDRLRADLNQALPPGLLCWGAAEVPLRFHARFSAVEREYCYLVGTPAPEPLAGRCWSLPDPRAFPDTPPATALDAGAMGVALASILGEHDFRGFARPSEDAGGTVRRVTSAEVLAAPWAPLYAVRIAGTGFVRAMVRHLVGTAVAVGLGFLPASAVAEILARRERYRGVRAPGWGLTLTKVTYPSDPFA
jgi:tRNA pseudouridine38-40 synthase